MRLLLPLASVSRRSSQSAIQSSAYNLRFGFSSSSSNNNSSKPLQNKYTSVYQKNIEKRFPVDRIAEVRRELEEQTKIGFGLLLSRQKNSEANFRYSSDVLVSNDYENKPLRDSINPLLISTAVWSSLTAAAALSGLPMLSGYLCYICPSMIVLNLVKHMICKRVVGKCISKIEFVPNEIEKVYITVLRGQMPLLVKIDTIEIIDVITDQSKIHLPYTQDISQIDEAAKATHPQNVQFTINFQDVSGEQHNVHTLVIFGNPALTTVVNYNLLRTVLQGDVVKLNKFKAYSESYQQQLESEDHPSLEKEMNDTVSDDFIDNLMADVIPVAQKETREGRKMPGLQKKPLITSSSPATNAVKTDTIETLQPEDEATRLERQIEEEIAKFSSHRNKNSNK